MTYIRAFDHTSELLEGNPLGDPHTRKLPVYLPPGYSDRRKQPYPVIFMLAGWGGRGAHYLSDGGAFSASIPEALDTLVESKQMHPCIVVFPDASTKLGASQYVNSPVTGPYMDYVCDELVDWVDRRFHTHASRDYRGIVGHSSGGFGALVSAMMRSDRFSALCSSAGDSFYELLYTDSIGSVVDEVGKAGGIEAFVNGFIEGPNPMGLRSKSAIDAMMVLSMASCFTPNPNVPVIYGDLWFDLQTGALIADVYQRLLAWDPVKMIDRFVPELRSLHWIHLEAGSDDEYGLHLGHRQLAARFEAHSIPFVLDEYPGKHSGHHYRMPERIRRLLDAMMAHA